MPIHVGLIGGGNITVTHALAAGEIPGLRIAAIYGTNAEKVAALSGEHGATAYLDFARFLAHRPMDMVAIGSPSGLHAEHGIAAAEHGLHVLVEKPIDTTTKRADALIAASDKAGVKLGVFYQDRFKPDLIRVKELLGSGALGKLILIDARVKWYRPPEYYTGSRWRGTWSLDGGGALINQGVHTVDLLLWLVGDVKRVKACTRTAFHAIETEDTAVALLEFANGALGTLQVATSAYPGSPRRVELTGTEGSVIVEQDKVVAAHLRTGEVQIGGSDGDRNSSASSPVISDIRGHKAALEDFIRAVETGTSPRCDGREARRSLALVEAIYRASAISAEYG